MKKTIIIFLLISSLPSQAATGKYDTTFGDQGISVLDLSVDPNIKEVPWDVAQGPDNKYYLVGESESETGDGYITLTRFNEDGSLDNTFSFDGYTTLNYNLFSSTDNDFPRNMYIQEDGKIYIIGVASTENGSQMAVARFLSNGTLDSSFSSDGKFSTSITPEINDQSVGYDMTIDDNGSIYVAGRSEFPALVKLLPNGLLDNSFNLTGKKIIDIDGLEGIITGIHIVETNKILVTGGVINPEGDFNFEFFAAKLNANGTFDTSFNAVGYRVIPIDLVAQQSDEPLTSLIDNTGRIFIIGAAINGFNNGDYDMAAVKLNPDGSFDNSFGTNGIVIVTINSGDDHIDVAYDAALQDDGKLVLCGLSGTSFSSSTPTYVRLLADGSRDFGFGNFGTVLLPGDPLNPSIVAQTSGCKIDRFGRLISSVLLDFDDNKQSISRIDLGLDTIFIDGFE